jgi:hypothetical protein
MQIQATSLMQNYPVGTYLVRARVQGGERVGFALSLRTVEDTKHMKAGGATKIHLSANYGLHSVI